MWKIRHGLDDPDDWNPFEESEVAPESDEMKINMSELPGPHVQAPRLPPAHERKRRRDENLEQFSKRLKAEKL